MSRALSGISSRSSSPRWMARTRAAHSTSSSRVVANRRPLGSAPTQCPARPMRCKATAIERGEPIWQTRSTVPMSMPSSSEAVATTARSSPFFSRRFRVQAQLAGEAAVMRQDRVFAQALAQVVGHALGQAARVDEHQGGAVLADEVGHAVVDLAPHFGGRDRAELVLAALPPPVPWRGDGRC